MATLKNVTINDTKYKLVFIASLPPRSTTQLPVFMQRMLASIVTLGRDS
jgi:hypothetical protein